MKIKFYKDFDSRWYADLPETICTKEEAEMVSGADTLLDIYAQGEDWVEIIISTVNNDLEPFDQAEKISENLVGADYIIKTVLGVEYNLPFWLCEVATRLYIEFPEKLNFKFISRGTYQK